MAMNEAIVIAVVRRDRDANAPGAWAGSSDGVLEERRNYCQNWRHDVVAGGVVLAERRETRSAAWFCCAKPRHLALGDTLVHRLGTAACRSTTVTTTA
jgi:hypothetical protein